MKIVNKKLLKTFTVPGLCECCHCPCPDGRDPHHLFTRGAGRVDIPENLVSLCRECHNSFHMSGRPCLTELLEVSAKRNGTTAEAIRAKVYEIRRK